MSEYLSEEQKQKLYLYSKNGRIVVDPITVLGERQDKTTLKLQIEIIEYERRVSNRS